MGCPSGLIHEPRLRGRLRARGKFIRASLEVDCPRVYLTKNRFGFDRLKKSLP